MKHRKSHKLLIAVAALVTVTAAGRGRAPDVGGYLDFLRLYSVQGFGQLPVPDWSLAYRWDIVLGRGGAGTTPLDADA